jgi:hypothetical protein
VKADDGAWSSLCGSYMSNSSVGATSHECRPPRLLARASVVEARRLGGGGRSSVEAVAASGPARARKQRDGGGRGRMGLVRNVAHDRDRVSRSSIGFKITIDLIIDRHADPDSDHKDPRLL